MKIYGGRSHATNWKVQAGDSLCHVFKINVGGILFDSVVLQRKRLDREVQSLDSESVAGLVPG